MEILGQNIWLLVVVGMIFVSAVISLIFILINLCISRQGKQTFAPLQRRYDSKLKSNKYQEINVFPGTPPLPPRTQFLLAEAQSYENLAKADEDEESLSNYEECVDPPPDCGNRNDGTELYCEPDPKTQSGPAAGKSYENLSEEHDYEESTDQLDYVKVDDEAETLPLPSQNTSHLKLQSQSGCPTQSYENLSEEHDYEESTDQLDYVKVDDEAETLPLPSQNTSHLKLQSQSGCSTQSYENLSEEHDYEESTDQLDYVKVDEEEETPPPPSQNTSNVKLQSQGSLSQSYDDLNEEPDYEEIADDQLDNVKVDDEAETLPPPSQNTSHLKLQSQSGCPTQSYENLSEEPDYEESIDDQLDNVKVDDEAETLPPPSQNTSHLKLQSQSGCPTQSYENLSEELDYEESIDDQLDYVKVDDEEKPSAQPPDPAAEDSSSEDYDDIGETSDGKEEEEDEDEDDYDDVA